jgi:predicted dehydrogenase
VGLGTVETMKQVKAKVLVIEAGKTIIFDQDQMIDAADASGISVVVQRDDSVLPVEDQMGFAAVAATKVTVVAEPAAISAPPRLLVRKARPGAVRVGVVGAGYLGGFHAQKYARRPEAQLVAVADVDAARANEVAAPLDTKHMVNYRDLIGQVEAVSIATPTPLHYSIARDFLEAGVHVLLEKPMTQTVAEAEQLIALAERHGCILQIGHLERFNSAFDVIRRHLHHPMFVEADRLALFNERGLDVDVVLDLMIHDIDIVLHIMDSPLKELRASGIAVLTALPDIASVRMEFANGAVANLTASRISTKNMRKLRVFQENSYYVADYAGRRAYAVYREQEADEDGYPQVSMEEIEIEERDALEEEVLTFLKAVRGGPPPTVGGREGKQALAVALEISSQIGRQLRARWQPEGDGLSRSS